MAKVVIFGIKDFAELAHFYLTNDSSHEVVGFCIDKKFLQRGSKFIGLPVVAFEDVDQIFSPLDYVFFAPMSPKGMNSIREATYYKIKQKGYQLISYISSHATVLTDKIGDNCFILEDNTIQPFSSIGNNVVLWSGNHIGHHSTVQDHVSITSHVVISGHCKINEFSFLGVNSTVRDQVTVAKGTLVAMDASITKDTDEWSVYAGVPARKLGGKTSRDLL